MTTPALDRMFSQILTDFKAVNDACAILSPEQSDVLFRDIRYVFLDNIAREIRFSFYHQESKEAVIFEYAYDRNGRAGHSGAVDMKEDLTGNIAFDVYIDFTDVFLQLDGLRKTLLLNNTELEWGEGL